MYIKLIQPKMEKRPMDTALKSRMAPPLGLLTIASLLRKNHRVVIENENIREPVYHDHPDIVGITVSVDALPRAIEIAARFRAAGVAVLSQAASISQPHPIPCRQALLTCSASVLPKEHGRILSATMKRAA